MYLVSSVWKFGNPYQATEAVRRLRTSFGPLIREQAGFRHWYLAVTGANEAVSVSIWESRAAYETAQPHLAVWGQQHLNELAAHVQARRRGDLAAREDN